MMSRVAAPRASSTARTATRASASPRAKAARRRMGVAEHEPGAATDHDHAELEHAMGTMSDQNGKS